MEEVIPTSYDERMRDGRLVTPDSSEGIGVYGSFQYNATEAALSLKEAWKRPVRHNLSIERIALWHVLAVDSSCTRILHPTGWPQLVRPVTGDSKARYETEAAIRTIPHIVPYTEEERQLLSAAKTADNLWWEHGTGVHPDSREAELFNRWHKWLWTDRQRPSEKSEASSDGQLLYEGCIRLGQKVISVLQEYDRQRR